MAAVVGEDGVEFSSWQGQRTAGAAAAAGSMASRGSQCRLHSRAGRQGPQRMSAVQQPVMVLISAVMMDTGRRGKGGRNPSWDGPTCTSRGRKR